MRKAACLLTILAACGGDDGPVDDTLVTDGGRFTVEGCDYEVVTRVDAEAPALGADVLGDDPDPFQVHLGLAGDPRTSMVTLPTASRPAEPLRVSRSASTVKRDSVTDFSDWYSSAKRLSSAA